MVLRLHRYLRHLLLFALYGFAGVVLTLLVVFVLYMNGREDLSVWHVAELDEEFTAKSRITSFSEYLVLEEKLFRQLDEEVYGQVEAEGRGLINRYSRGSLSDPGRWPQNWNRSYELRQGQPQAAVLLLHGMSDSPYSLRNLGERLHQAGVYVVGLRIPGHGTAPSGLVGVSWKDMAAAVDLAMRHLADKANGQPLHIVGYSNGAALGLNFALSSAADPTRPQITSLALISPQIGIAKAAALAVWQARLGTLLGLDKLAWNVILPEYDPYKYGSFAVNAGDVAYKLTGEVQRQITSMTNTGRLGEIPPILAFSSVVDATVSAPALVTGLFNRLSGGQHELVLFDINRVAEIEPVLKWSPDAMLEALQKNPDRAFTLGLVTNKSEASTEVVFTRLKPGETETTDEELGLGWPQNIYSLTHVALPFPPDDPLYGVSGGPGSPGINLGDIALRGERNVLVVPASELLRLRWNPFYPFVEHKVAEFFGLELP
ncbi:MAG: alpha/beta fold hydrolase [Gammaproteobacteria bacterium]|nr:alpha/beta fold hydrolase [Gammaproteobacteria bacterium]